MSKVTNNNFTPGSVVSRTDANAKFTDIQTATGSLNEENVRSEAVDMRTLDGHAYGTGRMEPLVHMDYFSNGVGASSTLYNNKDGQYRFRLTHGSPSELDWTSLSGGGVTMTEGDLLRINFTVFLEGHDDDTYEPAGQYAAGDAAPGRIGNVSDAIGLLFFPVWDIGSGDAAITNQVDLMGAVVHPHSFTIDGTSNRTDSLAWVSLEGIGSGGLMTTNRQVRGMFCYKHTGADIKIEKLRIYGRGPVVYQNAGGARSIHVPEWGQLMYNPGPPYAGLEIPGSGASGFEFRICAYQMSAIVLRGDS